MDRSEPMMREARAMMPAALWPDKASPPPAGTKQVLEVAVQRDLLCLKVRGIVDAMALVEDLSRAVTRARGPRRLDLDLEQLQGFHHLALSAVLVVLRNSASRFSSVLLRGLSPWARMRLHQTGADNIMGRGWALRGSGHNLELYLSHQTGGLPPSGS